MKKTVFIRSLSLFSHLSNVIGMSHFSYKFENDYETPMMILSESGALRLVELLRITVLLAFTYAVLQLPTFYLRYIQLIRFWTMIVLARIMNDEMIKLINGIVEFDQKLATLPIRDVDRSPGTTFWSIIFTAYFIFSFTIHKHLEDALMIQHDVFTHFIEHIFIPPRVVDFATTITACFFLCNLGHRFRAVTAVWRQTMIEVPTRRTTTETAVLVERLRLLHTDLSDLVVVFNACYGPIILALFVFLVADVICDMAYMMFFKDYVLGIAPYVQSTQNALFVTCILCIATWTNTAKKEMIKYLRSSQFSNLQYKAITQFKLFMNQIIVFEQTEMLAGGVLNFKLNFLISVAVFMVTVAATLMQMKNQPFLIYMFNVTYNDGPWND